MKIILSVLLLAITVVACTSNNKPSDKNNSVDTALSASKGDSTENAPDSLPGPFATKSVKNYCRVVGWPADITPLAPAGFTVTKFAAGLDNPRWIYQGPNGDIYVAEANTEVKGIKKIGAKIAAVGKSQKLGASANAILLFRDTNKDGVYEKQYVFATNLNRPFGMLILNNHFYIANTDALDRFDYTSGDTVLKGPATTILSLPGGGYNNHWTRNIIAGNKGNKLYISVGSGSNAGEHGEENEKRRADILEINPDGSGERIYASGLRNPAGMGWESHTGKLWVAVNERDELGDELVPDYITSVQEGGFYGWPYFYYGHHPDPRLKDNPHTELKDKVIVPDVPVGAHTASLGFTFSNNVAFPGGYRQGAFIGQHGSWNKSVLAGYKVVYVPFANGKPTGQPVDFLTGFIVDRSKKEVYGRPVGVTVIQDGSLLVADDAGNTIWKVSAKK